MKMRSEMLVFLCWGTATYCFQPQHSRLEKPKLAKKFETRASLDATSETNLEVYTQHNASQWSNNVKAEAWGKESLEQYKRIKDSFNTQKREAQRGTHDAKQTSKEIISKNIWREAFCKGGKESGLGSSASSASASRTNKGREGPPILTSTILLRVFDCGLLRGRLRRLLFWY